MSQARGELDLLEKLKKHPKLFARVEELLGVVENTDGDIKKASEAELRVIEEIRQMGHEALQSWAAGQVKKANEELTKKGGIRSAGKKNSGGTAHSGSSK
jgi:hypothetical protein